MTPAMDPWRQIGSVLAEQFGPTLITLSVMTALELLFPKERHTAGGRIAGVAFWIVYVPFTALAFAGLAKLWAALGVGPLIRLPLDFGWAGIAAAVLAPLAGAAAYDFFFYWIHRAQHRWLWRFHAVHHSIRDLSAVNSYHHLSEPVFQWVGILVPTSLIVADTGVTAPLIAVIVHLHASYIHSPTRLHFGPLRALICDNRFHRIHHSLEERHFDRNFGAFTTVWDRLFGTAHFPARDEWPATGLADIPQPATMAAWLTLPFAGTDPYANVACTAPNFARRISDGEQRPTTI